MERRIINASCGEPYLLSQFMVKHNSFRVNKHWLYLNRTVAKFSGFVDPFHYLVKAYKKNKNLFFLFKNRMQKEITKYKTKR